MSWIRQAQAWAAWLKIASTLAYARITLSILCGFEEKLPELPKMRIQGRTAALHCGRICVSD